MKIALAVIAFVLLIVVIFVCVVLWKARQVPKGDYVLVGYAARVASTSSP